MQSHELVRAEDDAPLAFGLSAVPRIAADRPKLAPAQAFAEPNGRCVGPHVSKDQQACRRCCA